MTKSSCIYLVIILALLFTVSAGPIMLSKRTEEDQGSLLGGGDPLSSINGLFVTP
ncbi:uncharacterized protein B0P05DRAFT_634759 [Gilbertella persicaria]|uniref:uncharacterized protein n=1 Tax=Gilbertella persicaria TaxID=101096 RepID=UPI0022202075|nr:uncharacterized protein B0P05DRAFT_634759 [Gilbertella persicaria]KAI8091077.1 hypothetical protein B0P05DRAFT_634759 [Gilbertella persicaria]